MSEKAPKSPERLGYYSLHLYKRQGFQISTLRTFLIVNSLTFTFSDFFYIGFKFRAENEFIGGQAMIIFEAYRSKMKIQQ